MQLSTEQRKLVEENHNLIYAVIHRLNLSVEDYYDIAAIGLCKAAIKYDSERGMFSTFAFSVIRNEILMDKRKDRAMARNGFISEPIYNGICEIDYKNDPNYLAEQGFFDIP